MKRFLLISSLALTTSVAAQFTSGTVNLGTTGMTLKLDTTSTLVTLTITGNDTSYLGIGFGNIGDGMSNGADGFIYNATSNRDYTFNGIGITPSPDSSQDWTQTSNTVSGGIRTVVATRSLNGGSGDTPISNAPGNVGVFFAKGNSTTISQHSSTNRGYATLNFSGSLATDEANFAENKVILYPNPAKETISFKSGKNIRSVEVLDVTGKKIKSLELDDEIEIGDLAPGNYYLEILLNDGSKTFEKLIKK